MSSNVSAAGSKVTKTYRSKVAATGAIERSTSGSSVASVAMDHRWKVAIPDLAAIDAYAAKLPSAKRTKVNRMVAAASGMNRASTLEVLQSALSRFIDALVSRSLVFLSRPLTSSYV